jgi:hypothetical protein
MRLGGQSRAAGTIDPVSIDNSRGLSHGVNLKAKESVEVCKSSVKLIFYLQPLASFIQSATARTVKHPK